ncbi:MAG: hypothetical protein PHI97_15810, partial [Desulfobulbus sp.]|nr:hypothetical protein [Desulfobulbus sp.]
MSADNPRFAELVQHCLPELPQGRGRILLPGDRQDTLATGSDRHHAIMPTDRENLTMMELEKQGHDDKDIRRRVFRAVVERAAEAWASGL